MRNTLSRLASNGLLGTVPIQIGSVRYLSNQRARLCQRQPHTSRPVLLIGECTDEIQVHHALIRPKWEGPVNKSRSVKPLAYTRSERCFSVEQTIPQSRSITSKITGSERREFNEP
jgi:hypothetical protein